MKIHTEYPQQSLAWFEARAGKVTASDMHRLVTNLGKVKTGEGPKTLLLEKLAEKFIGGPLPREAGSFLMEQGQVLEEYARPAFALETGMDVEQVGFIESDDGTTGCSPDGLILNRKGGCEIKCPGHVNHVRYLLDNVVPEDYVLQVQHSLFVTGFEFWWFFSYRRQMPPFILKVGRDEKLQAAIREAIDEFNAKLADGWDKLCQLNGGPPVRTKLVPPSTEPVKFTWEQGDDVVP